MDVTQGTREAVDQRSEGNPMNLMLSWARSTVASIEQTLGRAEDHIDGLLLGVLVVLALTIAFLFAQ